MFGSVDPSDNEVEKARRRLDGLAREGKAAKRANGSGGLARYLPIDARSAT